MAEIKKEKKCYTVSNNYKIWPWQAIILHPTDTTASLYVGDEE